MKGAISCCPRKDVAVIVRRTLRHTQLLPTYFLKDSLTILKVLSCAHVSWFFWKLHLATLSYDVQSRFPLWNCFNTWFVKQQINIETDKLKENFRNMFKLFQYNSRPSIWWKFRSFGRSEEDEPDAMMECIYLDPFNNGYKITSRCWKRFPTVQITQTRAYSYESGWPSILAYFETRTRTRRKPGL